MVYDPKKAKEITESIKKGQREVYVRKEKEKEEKKRLEELKKYGSITSVGTPESGGKEVQKTYNPKTKTITTIETYKNNSNLPGSASSPRPEVGEFQYQPQQIQKNKTILQQGNKQVQEQIIQQKISPISQINEQTRVKSRSAMKGTTSKELPINPVVSQKVKEKGFIAPMSYVSEEEKYALRSNKISSNEDVLLPISARLQQEYKFKGSSLGTTKGLGFNEFDTARKREQEFFNERATESGVTVIGSVATGYGAGLVLSAFPKLAAGLGLYGTYATGKSVMQISELSKDRPMYASYEVQKLGFGSIGMLYGGGLGSARFFKFTGGRSGKDFFNQEIRPNLDINVFPKVKSGIKTGFEIVGDIVKELTPTEMFLSKRASIGGRTAKMRSGRISKGELRKGKDFRNFQENNKQNVPAILRENKVNLNNIDYLKDSRSLNKAKVTTYKGLLVENKIKPSTDILISNLERIRGRDLPISPNVYPEKRINLQFKGKRTAYGRPKLELNIENSLGKPTITSKISSSYESGFNRLKYTPKSEIRVLDTSSGSLSQITKNQYKVVKLSSSFKAPKKITKKYEEINVYGRMSDKILKSRNDLYNKEIPISSATVKTIEPTRKGFRPGQFNKLKERIEFRENIQKLPSSESSNLFVEVKQKSLTTRQKRINIRQDSRTARFDFERNSKNTLKFIPERRSYNYEQVYPRGKLDFITERETVKYLYPKTPKPQKSTELSRVDLSRNNYVRTITPEYETPVARLEQFRPVGEVTVLPKNKPINANLFESRQNKMNFVGLDTQSKKGLVFTPMRSNLQNNEFASVTESGSIQDLSKDLNFEKVSLNRQDSNLKKDQRTDSMSDSIFEFKSDRSKTPKPRKPTRPVPYVPDVFVPDSPIPKPPRPKPPTPRPPRPIKPTQPVPPPPFFKLPEFPISSKQPRLKSYGAFRVEFKSKGKFKTLATGLTKEEAIKLGQFKTDTTTSRTFRIKRQGTTQRQKSGFVNVLRYRTSKKSPFTFIERNKFAISTSGEKGELRKAKFKWF